MAKQFTLGKKERLKSRKLIEQLFSEGKKLTATPFRVHYLFADNGKPLLQFGIAVSNKKFKKAVDRNRIKRLTKEAYRLQRLFLQQKLKEKNKALNIFFIYTGSDMPEYQAVSDATGKILDKLCHIVDSEK